MTTFNVNVPSQIDDNLTASTTQGASKTAINTALGLKANKVAISGATKTKITYNAEGIVTGGADATTADIADSLNKRYQTDNQQSFNDATSSIQTQLDSKVRDICFFQTSNQSIADSTSYYIACVTAPATSLALSSRIPIKSGTVVGASLGGFNASAIGSNEAWTVRLWYNDGLNSVVLTTNFTGGDANRNYFLDIDGLSTVINDGNCAIEFAAPALATNPTGFRPIATIYIKP